MSRTRKPDAERVRDIAPTGVRLRPPMREALEREAEIHQRSLSAEIIHRLRATLEGVQENFQPGAPPPAQIYRSNYDLVVSEAAGPLRMAEAKPPPLTDGERMALALFRGMPPEKQLALLTVLKR